MEELKLKKQKRKTTKEIKKEEKKIKEEAEKTKKVENIVNAKAKAKKKKEVIESEQQEKKIKLRIVVLAVLEWIVSLIEQFIIWLISLIGWVGILIILIVLVLMIVIYGLLHIDFTISDGKLFKGDTVEECISSGEVIGGGSFDSAQFSQLSGTLDDYKKNLMYCLQIYQELFNGDFGVRMWEKEEPEFLNSYGSARLSSYMMGFMAVETGASFSNGNKDIREYVTHPTYTHPSNGESYGFLGLNVKATLAAHAPDVATKLKEKYKPVDSYTYETDFVPYAIAIQTSQFVIPDGYLSGAIKDIKTIDADLNAMMDSYNIQANRERLKRDLTLFVAAGRYHGGTRLDVSRDNVIQLCSVWCALWSATSTDDSKRSFDNLKIIHTGGYDESTARKSILGPSNGNMSWDTNVTPYFSVNGQEITTTLWTWVRDNCSNKDYFNNTGAVYFSRFAGGKGGMSILNAHYGLMAYLTGDRIVNELGMSMPLASGGSYDECDCTEEISGYAGSLDLASVKAGEVQGPWSDATKEVLNKQTALKKYYGTAQSINNPNKKLSGLGITVEEWRLGTKWRIPYYFQDNNGPESAEGNIPSGWVSSLGSLGRAGCHIYMYSYMSSCLTGKVINPTEMTVALRHFGGITGTGLNSSSNAVKAFNDLGLKAVNIHSGSMTGDISDFNSFFGTDATPLKSKDSATLQAIFDTALNKNAVIGFAGGTGYFTANTNHYVVLHEKNNEGYRITGYNSSGKYPGSGWVPSIFRSKSHDYYDWDFVYKSISGHTRGRGYDFQIFVAWNPNITEAGQVSLGMDTSSVTFEKFLFVGDSHTYGIEPKITAENKGHIVKAISGKDAKYWLDNYSELKGHDINGIIVDLGSNNNTDVDSLKTLLTNLKTDYPDKPIYAQKVFPLGSNYTYADVTTMNTNVSNFNTELKSFCDTTDGITFIDTTTGLVTDDGFLANPDTEGIHLGTDADRTKWWENIKTAISGSTVPKETNPDMRCVEAPINSHFTETPGQFQGPWGDLTEYVNQMTIGKEKSLNLIPHVGKKPVHEGDSNYEYKVDKWKAYNGVGTVRYCQCSSCGEPYNTLSSGDSTLGASACGAFSAACIISTMTGKYVNTAEVALAVNTYELRHPGSNLANSNNDGDGAGAFTHTDLAKVIEECGLKTECLESVDVNKIDNCLNNNGMVIICVNNSLNNRFTQNAHYVAIRERTEKGYLIYSSTNWSSLLNDKYCNTETTTAELRTLDKGQIVLVNK